MGLFCARSAHSLRSEQYRRRYGARETPSPPLHFPRSRCSGLVGVEAASLPSFPVTPPLTTNPLLPLSTGCIHGRGRINYTRIILWNHAEACLRRETTSYGVDSTVASKISTSNVLARCLRTRPSPRVSGVDFFPPDLTAIVWLSPS